MNQLTWVGFSQKHNVFSVFFFLFSLMKRAKMSVSELGNYEHFDAVSWFVGDKWEGALKDWLQWKMGAFGTVFSGEEIP